MPLVLYTQARGATETWRSKEVRRWPAPEANQAVAVDARHFYAIGNHVIAKYDKKTGQRVSDWECEKGNPLIHLNSGIVRDGVLYCAHSNYPSVPMVSSIEMFDTKTMRHTGTHSFGIVDGSATSIDFRQGRWYVTFGHYGTSRENRIATRATPILWNSMLSGGDRKVGPIPKPSCPSSASTRFPAEPSGPMEPVLHGPRQR